MAGPVIPAAYETALTPPSPTHTHSLLQASTDTTHITQAAAASHLWASQTRLATIHTQSCAQSTQGVAGNHGVNTALAPLPVPHVLPHFPQAVGAWTPNLPNPHTLAHTTTVALIWQAHSRALPCTHRNSRTRSQPLGRRRLTTIDRHTNKAHDSCGPVDQELLLS